MSEIDIDNPMINVPDEDYTGDVSLAEDGDAVIEDSDDQVQSHVPDPSEEIRNRLEIAESRAAAAEARMQQIEDEKREAEFAKLEEEILANKSAAREEGDVDRIDDEWMKLRKLDLERAKAANKPAVVATEKPTIVPAANEWLSQNPWFSNPKYAEQRSEAIAIEKELRESGKEMDEGFYKELDKRMLEGVKKKAPKVNIAPPSRADVPPRAVDKSVRGGTARLTNRDRQVMNQFNLDPDNAKHRESYLKRRG